MKIVHKLLPAVSLLALVAASPALSADALLSGAIKSATGEVLGGVTVSAKPSGGTITTTVFTDETGAYYFPPLPEGKYSVWAQAIGFRQSKSDVDVTGKAARDFSLEAITEREAIIRQLPGDLILAGLPEATADEQRMKRIVRNNCTSCHGPGYTLQHRFDEQGWNAIITAMKNVNVYGVYRQGADFNEVLDHHQPELAAYLAKARGPGDGAFKITTRPRPSGEAARAVFREYDVPRNPHAVLPASKPVNDGTNWALGTPSRVGSLPHDAAADNDGNLWFAAVQPNRVMSVGRIDAKTGAIKPFKIDAPGGIAAISHGLIRDDKGIIWFNVRVNKGGLAKIDPKTEKFLVYMPPENMSQIEGPVTLDTDALGRVWAGTADGVLRFDPDTEKFTEFKSKTPRTAKGGLGATYGIAGDKEGNVWWTQMAFDTVAKSDVKTGGSIEMRLPPVKEEYARATNADLKFYDGFAPKDIGTPYPWSQGPRRIGMDREADVLWVANSWGGTLTRIDGATKEVTEVPLPQPTNHQPYSANVDSKHNVWVPLWTTDQMAKYDPASKKWTLFDYPTRGTEVRLTSTRDVGGKQELTFAYVRTSKVAVMTVRDEAEMRAAKAAAGR